MIKNSDIISIHLPAADETKHLINRDVIKQMKKGVLIVNTARGSIVNEEDVADAFKDCIIGGFATDVFEREPVDTKGALFGLDHYIATPHAAAETYENCETTSIVTARAVLAALRGQEPENRLV